MSSRRAVGLALLAGIVVAWLALVAVVALLPAPVRPPGPTPYVAPSPTPPPSSSATLTPVPSPLEPSPSASAEPPASQSAFGIGRPAPPLRVPRLGGGTIDLAELRGKPVWLNFMQTTCPACVDEFPPMNVFAIRHEEDGLVVLAIDIREDAATARAFGDRLSATFPIGLDTDGAAQRAWGAFALPVHFWIDREGIVRSGALGGIGRDVMAASLGRILPGVTVTP